MGRGEKLSMVQVATSESEGVASFGRGVRDPEGRPNNPNEFE